MRKNEAETVLIKICGSLSWCLHLRRDGQQQAIISSRDNSVYHELTKGLCAFFQAVPIDSPDPALSVEAVDYSDRQVAWPASCLTVFLRRGTEPRELGRI
jgi:hypothetical protein